VQPPFVASDRQQTDIGKLTLDQGLDTVAQAALRSLEALLHARGHAAVVRAREALTQSRFGGIERVAPQARRTEGAQQHHQGALIERTGLLLTELATRDTGLFAR
jgi:hypothetical protein